ncbi:hypothetical protein AARAC_009009 [Aspergillus arachidicola]|uniref:NADP-dependent oxidoreductase domain-containing protein n=1 Tax=Aspergillus arachidicola TaxID=656916 RepID=A0A2G7G1Z6_9EURO|nr:hypothetical protein AARAC_009009 [Aspergillus arachidicola]
MSLPQRSLGIGGPRVTAVGLGLMGMSAFYGKPAPDAERFELLDHAFASGELFWDTADVYGDSEDLIGRWFQRNPGKRDQIFLATKFGIAGPGVARGDPEYVKLACNRSLARLGVDHIDLYYVHRVDKSVPIEKTVAALVDLKKYSFPPNSRFCALSNPLNREGKIRYIGLSEVSARTLRRAHAVHPISALQVEYSLFTLEIEARGIDLLDVCRELDVAVVAYSPLGRGMLTGKYKDPSDFEEGDFRKLAPRYSHENFANNLKLVDSLHRMAHQKGCTGSQLVLAWLLAQGNDIIPIPGTTRIQNLDENIGALHVSLSQDEIKDIRGKVEQATIYGERYPAAFAQTLLADTEEL